MASAVGRVVLAGSVVERVAPLVATAGLAAVARQKGLALVGLVAAMIVELGMQLVAQRKDSRFARLC